MTISGAILVLLTVGWLVHVLSRDFARGVSVSIALLICLPHRLRFAVEVAPDLTIHRIILIILAVYWLRSGKYVGAWRATAFIWWLAAFGLAQMLSMVLSTQFVASLKDFSAFAFEVFLFYLIVSSSLDSRRVLRGHLTAMGVGVAIVGLTATIERYAGFNLATFVAPSGGWIEEGAITGPYVNRILLGYGMAMGLPILFAKRDLLTSSGDRIILSLMLSVVIASCYFSASRGPWLGMCISAGGLLFVGSRSTRGHLLRIAALAAVVLVARPGVKDTIVNLVDSTFQSDTLRGSSYEYRWILWSVATGEIGKAAERLVFGYGGHSTEYMDLSSYFGHERGGTTLKLGYTSWDNHYASDLIEFGYLGFLTECALYVVVALSLCAWWWRAAHVDRPLLGSMALCCAVFLFAMSNVYIFAPQLKFLFWSAVAIASCASRRLSLDEPVAVSIQTEARVRTRTRRRLIPIEDRRRSRPRLSDTLETQTGHTNGAGSGTAVSRRRRGLRNG